MNVCIKGELEQSKSFVLLHHGAGYTGQTWLQLINVLQESLPSVCFVTFDMRGHGQSTIDCKDFSLETLINDAKKVLEAVLTDKEENSEVFLIGHSLGAAILAALPHKFSKIKFSGLVMVDIIEGNLNCLLVYDLFIIDLIETAVQALSRMPSVLSEIPKSFPDIKSALKWSISSSHSHHSPQTKRLNEIERSLSSQLEYNEKEGRFEWITDLSQMAPFWDSWFAGLTGNFLKFSGSRLLILASDTDHMDREMTIAQMQGKFQLIVIRESGHAVQEDQPEQMAEPISLMIRKHMKLSEILNNK